MKAGGNSKKYIGVCVGGPRDGQRMSHDHRVRMHEEWRNNTFIVTGPGSKENQWITTGKYVYEAKHERWNWEAGKPEKRK